MIKIVWIINEKYTNNFITVYNEIKKDKRFDLTVVAAPRLGAPHCDAISSAETADYLREKGVSCVDCYDTDDGACLDLRELAPDYVFRSTYYDIYYPAQYRSDVVARYAKLCFVEYGAWLYAMGVLPSLQLAHFLFCSFDHKDVNIECTPCGNLKLDEYLYYNKEPQYVQWGKNDKLRVLWKPRWTLEEDSTLFKYIEQVYTYLKNNDFVDLIFLAHPMLYSKLRQQNKYEEFEVIHKKLQTLDNYHVEESDDFLDTAYTCDVLIADHSSILAECAIFGKEIIYTGINEIEMNNYGRMIMADSYVAHSFGDMETALKDIYSKKTAGLLSRDRKQTVDKFMFVPPNGMSVAQYLLECIYNDYYSVAQDIIKRICEDYSNKKDGKKHNVPLEKYIRDRIEGQETIVAEKLRQITFLEETIENLQTEKQSLQAEKQSLQTEKQNLQTEKQNLQTEKQNLQTEKQNLQAETQNLNRYIDELEKQIGQLESAISEMQESSSWRLTKPLRGVIDWLRGTKKG